MVKNTFYNKASTLALVLLLWTSLFSAQTKISGFVYKYKTRFPLHQVKISILETGKTTTTDRAGYFVLENLPSGVYTFRLSKMGYATKEMKIEVLGKKIKLSDQFLEPHPADEFTKALTYFTKNSSFQTKLIKTQNITQAFSQEIEDKTIVRELNQAIFDRKNRTLKQDVFFWNRVPMNNDHYLRLFQILASNPQENTPQQEIGITRIGKTGGLLDVGSSPLHQEKGINFSYDFSQQAFNNRYQLAYNSGITKKGYGILFAGSLINGDQLLAKESETDGKGLHLAGQKIWKKNRLDISFTYSDYGLLPQETSTKEVYDLKSDEYNPLWGQYRGQSRKIGFLETEISTLQTTYKKQIDFYKEIVINAYQSIEKNNQNQFFTINTSSPLPNSIRNLPSYLVFLGRDDDEVQNKSNLWVNDFSTSQINWQNIYLTNGISPNTSITNSNLNSTKNGVGFWYKNSNLQSGVFNFRMGFENSKKQDYSRLIDLLGANSITSLQDTGNPNSFYNVEKPNDFVAGDKWYDYQINTNTYSFGSSYQKKIKNFDYGIAFEADLNSLYREGNIRNEYFTENSKGESLTKYSVNSTSKFNLAYLKDQPTSYYFSTTFRNFSPNESLIFPMKEYSNLILENLENEKTIAIDSRIEKNHEKRLFKINPFIDYTFDGTVGQRSIYDLNLAGEYSNIKSSNDILTGVQRLNYGAEIYSENPIGKRIVISTLMSFSRNTFQNNPTITSYPTQLSDENIDIKKSEAKIDGLYVGGTPQNLLHTNLSYQTQTNLSFVIGANFLFSNYSIPNFYRYSRVILEEPYTIEQKTFDHFQKQRKLPNFFLINAFISKSHQSKWLSIQLNAGVANLLDTKSPILAYQNSFARSIDYWQMAYNQESKIFQDNILNSNGRMLFAQLKLISW